MLLCRDADGRPSADAYEWEPAHSLSHVVSRGLDYPRRAFSLYLAARDRRIDRAILAFTADDQLVLGLCVDDGQEKPETDRYARGLLDRLVREFDCHRGAILVEWPPPGSEEEFVRESEGPHAVHSWKRHEP